MFHGLCILARITGQKHPGSGSVQPQPRLQGLQKMGVRVAIYHNQKQCPQGVRCFHSVRARKCSHFAARLQFAALSIPPLCSHGGRRGDNADLWLLLTNSLFPFPTSAPSTATTPTAKGQTCSAPPWASPQPLWTVPPGQASVLTVSLGVNNAAPCLECCCFRCLFCPHLLGEGGLSVTAVDSAQKGWA